MKSESELRYLGNIIGNLSKKELYTVLNQMQKVMGYGDAFCTNYEEGMSGFLNELELIARTDITCFDFDGEPDTEEYNRDHENYPTVYPEIPHVVRLTKSDIDIFNRYLEDAKMDIAFGNTDWNGVYRKIVGDKSSEYAEAHMDRYREFTR